MRRSALSLVVVTIVALAACRTTRDGHTNRDQATTRMQPTVLDYVDTDGFDGIFEASLVSRDPVIIVRTENEKPDWQGRLNVWIAAWNQGGKLERRIVRGQIPLHAIDGDTLREFRLLVFGLVDRAEDLAKAGSTWWHDDRMRARRVELLRPYNLRFHVSDENRIQLIFFNGNHAAHYPEVMAELTGNQENDWSRTVECSACKKFHDAARARQRMPAAE